MPSFPLSLLIGFSAIALCNDFSVAMQSFSDALWKKVLRASLYIREFHGVTNFTPLRG
jgi:hypothetical protein